MTHQHEHGSQHPDPTAPDQVHFTEDFWEQRYQSKPAIWSGNPNAHLIEEASDLSPGRAVDVGSGEGADAIWLAQRGWSVLAVDWSDTALRRGQAAVEAAGAEMAERIRWERQDLTSWEPEVDGFDLVSCQYLHLPPDQWDPLFERLTRAVRTGGTLLIVGHHPEDLHTTMPRPNRPELFQRAEDWSDRLRTLVATDDWTVHTTATAPRTATDPEGREVTLHDAVFRAERKGMR